MKKSIYLFIGGSLFGVIAAILIVKSTTNTEQTNPIASNVPDAKIVTAKMQAAQMQASDMPMESMSDMQVRLSQQAGMSGMESLDADMQNDPAENGEAPIARLEPPQPSLHEPQKQMAVVPVTPPTTEQVQQYNDMEKIITSAVNNPKIKLIDLLRQSDTLTIQQRNQLTQKTMDMINRGELSIDQFANNQTPSK